MRSVSGQATSPFESSGADTRTRVLMAVALYVGWTKYRDQQRTPLALHRNAEKHHIFSSSSDSASISRLVPVSHRVLSYSPSSFQRVIDSLLSTRIILQARKAASSPEEHPIE
jgi:hypothetical protein